MPINALTGIDSKVAQPIGLRPSIGATINASPNTGNQFTRGLRRGVATVTSAAQGVVATGAGIIGADQFAQEQAVQAQQRVQEAAQQNPLRIEKIEDIRTDNFEDFVNDAGDYIAGIAGQQTPILASLAVGAGVGGLAVRAATGLSGAASAATGAGIASSGLETGLIFPEIATDEGATGSMRSKALTAAGFGIAAGSMDALPVFQVANRFGLGKSLNSTIKRSLLSRTGIAAAQTSVTEAGTEAVQTLIERGARKFANDNFEILGPEGVSEIINATVAGGIIGFGVGGFSGVVSPSGGAAEADLSILDGIDAKEEGAIALANQRIKELRGLVPDETLDRILENAQAFPDQQVFDEIASVTPVEVGEIRDSKYVNYIEKMASIDPQQAIETLMGSLEIPGKTLNRREITVFNDALSRLEGQDLIAATNTLSNFQGTPEQEAAIAQLVKELGAEFDPTGASNRSIEAELEALALAEDGMSIKTGNVFSSDEDIDALEQEANDYINIVTRHATAPVVHVERDGRRFLMGEELNTARGFEGDPIGKLKQRLEGENPEETFRIVPAREVASQEITDRFGPEEIRNADSDNFKTEQKVAELEEQVRGLPASYDKADPLTALDGQFAIMRSKVPANVEAADRIDFRDVELDPGLTFDELTKRKAGLDEVRGDDRISKERRDKVKEPFKNLVLKRAIVRNLKRGGGRRNNAEFYVQGESLRGKMNGKDVAGKKMAAHAPNLTRAMFNKLRFDKLQYKGGELDTTAMTPADAARAFMVGTTSLRRAGFVVPSFAKMGDLEIMRPSTKEAKAGKGFTLTLRDAVRLDRLRSVEAVAKSVAIDTFTKSIPLQRGTDLRVKTMGVKKLISLLEATEGLVEPFERMKLVNSTTGEEFTKPSMAMTSYINSLREVSKDAGEDVKPVVTGKGIVDVEGLLVRLKRDADNSEGPFPNFDYDSYLINKDRKTFTRRDADGKFIEQYSVPDTAEQEGGDSPLTGNLLHPGVDTLVEQDIRTNTVVWQTSKDGLLEQGPLTNAFAAGGREASQRFNNKMRQLGGGDFIGEADISDKNMEVIRRNAIEEVLREGVTDKQEIVSEAVKRITIEVNRRLSKQKTIFKPTERSFADKEKITALTTVPLQTSEKFTKEGDEVTQVTPKQLGAVPKELTQGGGRTAQSFATENDPKGVADQIRRAVEETGVKRREKQEEKDAARVKSERMTPESIRAVAFNIVSNAEKQQFYPQETLAELTGLGKSITTVTTARQVLAQVKDSPQHGSLRRLVKDWSRLLNVNARVLDVEEAVDTLLEVDDYGRLRGILDGSLNGFSLPDGRLFVNPQLPTNMQVEVLAHEMGHAVFKQTVPSNPGEFTALHNAWAAWRKEFNRPGALLKDVEKSKQRLRAAINRSYNHTSLTLDSLSDVDRQYVLDFEEWVADQTALWLTQPNTKPNGATEGWFVNFVKAIRSIFTNLTEDEVITDAQAAVFLNDKVASFAARMTKNQPHIGARVSDSRSVGLKGTAGSIKEERDQAVAGFVRYAGSDPTSDVAHAAIIEFLFVIPTQEEMRVLGNAFTQGTVRRQMNLIFKDHPNILNDIDSSVFNTVAYGYQLWVTGKLDVGPQVRGVFGKILDFFRKALGFVSNAEQTDQLLEQLQNNTYDIDRLISQGSAFELKTAVRDTVLQNIAQSTSEVYDRWAKPWMDRIFLSSLSRMMETGNPALQQLALKVHTPPNAQGRSQGYLANKEVQRTQFADDISRATNGETDPEVLKQLWEALMTDETPNSPKVKHYKQEVRKRLDEIYDYAKRKGLKMGLRKNYFPWVYNQEYMQNHKDEFVALLKRPAYRKKIDGMAKQYTDAFEEHLRNAEAKSEEETTQKFQKYLGRAQVINERFGTIDTDGVIELIYDNIADVEGYGDAEINFDRASHIPFVRAMNTRSLNFLMTDGTKQDRKDFMKFFHGDFNYSIRTYIDQIVKRAEFTDTFNAETQKDGKIVSDVDILLREASLVGASEKELALANDFVNSAQGTIGARTSQWLGKIPLIGESIGSGPEDKLRVINPRLQMAQSWVMLWQNFRVLGMVTLTSLADPVGIAVRGGSMDTVMASIKALRKDSKAREVAEKLGIISTYTINEMLTAIYSNNYMTAKAQATNEAFFKWTGLSALTRATRAMATGGALEFLRTNSMSDTELAKRYLADLNLEASDVVLDEQSNVKIRNRPEMDQLWEAFEKGGDPTILAEIEREERVRKAINRFVDEAVLRPNAATRPIWASDPHFALIFHLKSFTYTFYNQILKRVFNEATLGNYMPVALLFVYVPIMIFADLLREVARFGLEGNPRKANWGLWDYTNNAVQRSGLMGVSQFMLDAKQDRQFGGIGIESFLGPTAASIASIDDVLLNNDGGRYQGILDQMPLQNTFLMEGLR